MNIDIDGLRANILDHLPQAVFVKDRDGRFTYANRAMAVMFGVEPTQFLGRTDADFIRPEAVESYIANDQKVISEGQSVTEQEFFRSPHGDRRVVQVTKVPIRDESGTPFGILGTVLDVSTLGSEHDRIERTLEEKEKVLQDTSEQLSSLPLVATSAQTPPCVFVSYKHSDSHSQWVRQFVSDLIAVHEVNCILDQFDLDFGDSIQSFMQRIQTEATHFLMIITPEAVSAIEQSAGGVAFEAQVAATRRSEGKLKLIPVLRSGDQTPAYVRSHLYIDFRVDAIYRDMLKRLADAIKGTRQRPILGSRKHEA